MALLIILTIFTMPVCIGWDEVSDSMENMNLIIDIIFLFDVLKNFNTGFVNQDDVTVMDRPAIVSNYLKGWFLIDLVSSIPVERLSSNTGENSNLTSANSSLKGLKLLRIAKVLRLFKLSKTFRWVKMWINKLEERLQWRLSDGTIKLTKLAIFVLLAAHWIACLQWYLCRFYDFPEDSWVVFSELVRARATPVKTSELTAFVHTCAWPSLAPLFPICSHMRVVLAGGRWGGRRGWLLVAV